MEDVIDGPALADKHACFGRRISRLQFNYLIKLCIYRLFTMQPVELINALQQTHDIMSIPI